MTTKLQQYEQSYSGKETLGKYVPGEAGIWEVRDAGDVEGRNVRSLGFYSGLFSDVLNLALTFPNFEGMGNFGRITKIEYVQVNHTTTVKRLELLDKQSKLKSELAKIEHDLTEWN